jgi:hypothetical protein
VRQVAAQEVGPHVDALPPSLPALPPGLTLAAGAAAGPTGGGAQLPPQLTGEGGRKRGQEGGTRAPRARTRLLPVVTRAALAGLAQQTRTPAQALDFPPPRSAGAQPGGLGPGVAVVAAGPFAGATGALPSPGPAVGATGQPTGGTGAVPGPAPSASLRDCSRAHLLYAACRLAVARRAAADALRARAPAAGVDTGVIRRGPYIGQLVLRGEQLPGGFAALSDADYLLYLEVRSYSRACVRYRLRVVPARVVDGGRV